MKLQIRAARDGNTLVAIERVLAESGRSKKTRAEQKRCSYIGCCATGLGGAATLSRGCPQSGLVGRCREGAPDLKSLG